VAFCAIGIYLSVDGILGIFRGEIHTDTHPGLMLLESLDVFLVAIVFFIFAIGIAVLFLAKPKEDGSSTLQLPKWLNINNFTDLKLLLWEAVLTTLVVYFVSDIIKKDGHYDWTILLLPGAILLLTVSTFLLKKGH